MRPQTEQDVVDAVRAAGEARHTLAVRGTGSLASRLPGEGEADEALELGELSGVVDHRPGDLVVVVRPGSTVQELDDALAEVGQEVPIHAAPGCGTTVGGVLASGLAGPRRLGVGPARDWILGGRLVGGQGQVCRVGGATMKNVTGYDLPKLLCGSWGTLGALTEVTLRTRARRMSSTWFRTDQAAGRAMAHLYSPSTVLAMPQGTWVLLEGHPDDCAAQAAAAGLTEAEAPTLPNGARLSVPPAMLDTIVGGLGGAGSYAAEQGVGIVHLDQPDDVLVELRSRAEAAGGRLVVFDRPRPVGGCGNVSGDRSFHERLRAAFDPQGVFAPCPWSAA